MNDLNIEKKVDFSFATLILTKDGIAVLDFKDNQEISLDNAIELNETLATLIKGIRVPILMIMGEFTNYSDEAKSYSASYEGTKYSLAEAILVKNIGLRIVAQMYLVINKPSVPTKFFTKTEDAIVWLKSYF